MSSAFPSLPSEVSRAAALGVDVDRSLRQWVGSLTGKSGAELDELIAEGARFGAGTPEVPPGYIEGRHPRSSTRLAPAEVRALTCAAIGMDSTDTAKLTGRSPWTIKMQLKSARRKMGAATVTEATVQALITGQLELAVLADHFERLEAQS